MGEREKAEARLVVPPAPLLPPYRDASGGVASLLVGEDCMCAGMIGVCTHEYVHMFMHV